MDRRTAIRNLAIVIGGAVLLPACTKHNPIAHFKHFDIDLDQQTLITDMAETVIPKTNTPGATDLNLYGFIMKMMDDCTKKEDQQTFLKGMREFNTVPQKLFKKDFAACTKQQKEEVLKSFEKKDNGYSKDLLSFYNTVKGLTVFGYTESKYFLTKEVVYELIPGRYNAYFPVKNLKA
ncbi:gluconate 2-dehydrogenase subunit 3 family protein [Mucilaginibacter sp. McL0603]|uniref:gluconate 2-dehydrogenase subunit 3 family protein n=1 Tax=Mucilaginibacter sp. McL0603 TaxID=3415670 RepID=UPI003CEA2763